MLCRRCTNSHHTLWNWSMLTSYKCTLHIKPPHHIYFWEKKIEIWCERVKLCVYLPQYLFVMMWSWCGVLRSLCELLFFYLFIWYVVHETLDECVRRILCVRREKYCHIEEIWLERMYIRLVEHTNTTTYISSAPHTHTHIIRHEYNNVPYTHINH